MKILVTGIAGFAGSHLAAYLTEQPDLCIHGIIHRHAERIQHLHPLLTLHQADLRDGERVDEIIRLVQPDQLIHLAAWSDVGGSWRQPWVVYEANIHSQLNLLESVRHHSPACRVLVTTSNEVYGLVRAEDLPIHEAMPLRPNSPYGVSKATQDLMAQQYWFSYGMPVVRARSFNHIGPGQSDTFVASAFARQIAEIETGRRDPVLKVGNLAAERDFTDVRDMATAYWALLESGQAGEAYNVGSGQSRSIRWILDTLLSFSRAAITVEPDPDRLRPSDVLRSVCDNRKLVAATDWQPQRDLRQTLNDILNDWRTQIAAQD